MSTDLAAYVGLFGVACLAATLLPAQSEALLYTVSTRFDGGRDFLSVLSIGS